MWGKSVAVASLIVGRKSDIVFHQSFQQQSKEWKGLCNSILSVN